MHFSFGIIKFFYPILYSILYAIMSFDYAILHAITGMLFWILWLYYSNRIQNSIMAYGIA